MTTTTTTIYAYAITDPLAPPADLRGLDDAPLETVEAGRVCAVYSSHEQLALTPEPELLWRHDLVIERLMELGAVLPLRFGTEFHDPEELGQTLNRQAPRWERLLARVRGCVELSVRVGVAPPPERHETSGTAYLQRKLAATRERERAAQRVLAPLRALAQASSRRATPGESGTLRESYLVRGEALEAFIAEAGTLQARNGDVSLSCTGPWGPYSFVDEDEA